MQIQFSGMYAVHNFIFSSKGRIFVVWNPACVDLRVLDMGEQCIHVRTTCLRSKTVFCASFVYGLNKIVGIRLLWLNLKQFGDVLNEPWILLGYFNNVLSLEEKSVVLSSFFKIRSIGLTGNRHGSWLEMSQKLFYRSRIGQNRPKPVDNRLNQFLNFFYFFKKNYFFYF